MCRKVPNPSKDVSYHKRLISQNENKPSPWITFNGAVLWSSLVEDEVYFLSEKPPVFMCSNGWKTDSQSRRWPRGACAGLSAEDPPAESRQPQTSPEEVAAACEGSHHTFHPRHGCRKEAEAEGTKIFIINNILCIIRRTSWRNSYSNVLMQNRHICLNKSPLI